MFQAKPVAYWLISIAVLSACWASTAVAGQVEFDIPLDCPKLESLQATIPASGGSVAVSLHFAYDSSGKLYCAPGSTVGGATVTGKGSQKGTADSFTFSISVKGSGKPSTSLSISGVSEGGVAFAKCSYKGSKGKAGLRSHPVDVESSTPTAHVSIDTHVDAKGKMTGTGTIESGFGNDIGEGILKGQVAKGKVKWTLKQGRQSLSFSGVVENLSTWIGTLKVGLSPVKATLTEFDMAPLGESNPPDLTDYFPFTSWKTWTYARKGSPSDVTTITCNGLKIFNGESLTELVGISPGHSTQFYMAFTNFGLVCKGAIDQDMPNGTPNTKVYTDPEIWLPADAKDGFTWKQTFTQASTDEIDQIINIDGGITLETVTVPAGMYPNCLKSTITYNSGKIITQWYAPTIGMVKRSVTKSDGEPNWTIELVSTAK